MLFKEELGSTLLKYSLIIFIKLTHFLCLYEYTTHTHHPPTHTHTHKGQHSIIVKDMHFGVSLGNLLSLSGPWLLPWLKFGMVTTVPIIEQFNHK